MFNLNGIQWRDIVSVLPGSYQKRGGVQDTAYWSENILAREYTDRKIVLALSRPSLSNTFVFKAGNTYKVEVAFIQIGATLSSKAYGVGTVEWSLTERNLSGAFDALAKTSLALLTTFTLA